MILFLCFFVFGFCVGHDIFIFEGVLTYGLDVFWNRIKENKIQMSEMSLNLQYVL